MTGPSIRKKSLKSATMPFPAKTPMHTRFLNTLTKDLVTSVCLSAGIPQVESISC